MDYNKMMSPLMEDILEELVDASLHPYKLVYGYIPKEYSRNHVRVTLHRLERQGLIEKIPMENEICLRLTELGLQRLSKDKQKRQEFEKPNILAKKEKWDGLWRIIVFDVPESNRRIRDTLRQTLRLLEFYPLQKSVWVSKNNYTKELRSWVRELGLTDHIKIFETPDLGIT